MDAAADPELHHAEDALSLPSGLLDVEMPLASVHDLLRDSQLSLPWFDFSTSEGQGTSPKPQVDASSSADNLSDHSAPSLITNHSSILPHPQVTGVREETPCRNPQGPCTDLTTKVLSSMHPGSYSCVLSMTGQDGDRRPQPSRGADAVLSQSQSALAAVRSVLQCTCRGLPQVLLLVTTICSQVGASYRQVADIYSLRRKPNANSAVLSISGGKVETQRREFFIGNHRLSQDVEAAAIRQVLLGMLRELDVIIADIACYTGQSPEVNDPTSDQMLSGVRSRMVGFLHTQVRALASALEHVESGVGPGLPPISHY